MMNSSRGKRTLWTLAFCLTLAVATPPVLAKGQSGSGDTSSSETTKSRKKAKKDKAATDRSGKTAATAPAAATPASGSTAPASEVSKESEGAASGTASSSDIAAAKASGKVWVNLDSGIYHRGGRWYGKTKNGKFMTEAEAKAAGYKESQRN